MVRWGTDGQNNQQQISTDREEAFIGTYVYSSKPWKMMENEAFDAVLVVVQRERFLFLVSLHGVSHMNMYLRDL